MNYLQRPETAQCENINSGMYTSGVMNIVPDPGDTKRLYQRTLKFREDLNTLDQKHTSKFE